MKTTALMLVLAGFLISCSTPNPPPVAPSLPPIASSEPPKPPATHEASKAAAKAAVPASTAPVAPPKHALSPPKPAERQVAKPAPAPAPALAPAVKPAPLDLKSLEQRLKDTGAIGVMTKLSLKNQVDDLVAKFRAYHGGERPPTLPQLRPAFELLLMKVLSLLQDKDPGLARDVDTSREAMWGVLSDPNKFAQLS